MSKIVYLLGGAGNVFFQMLQVAKKDESVLLCDFFIRPSVISFTFRYCFCYLIWFWLDFSVLLYFLLLMSSV